MISPILSYSSIINIPDDQSTLQAGISTARSGDTVPIIPGTNTNASNYNLTTSVNTIMFLGQKDADSTIVDCAGTHNEFSTVSSGTRNRGITISNGMTAINCGSYSPIIDICKFINRGTS